MGVLLTAAVSTASGLYVFTALSLSLSFAACASLLLLLWAGEKDALLEAKPEVLRLLKHERGAVSLRVRSRARRWSALSSASPPRAAGLSLVRDESREAGSFTVAAEYAGRYECLELTATFTDALGVFRKVVRVRPEKLVVEVLPLSILAPSPGAVMSAVTWGEVPAGRRGSGQEFYGVEDYAGAESKDILWKRVSREPEQRIVARVREMNLPRSLRVALVSSAAGDRTVWMDTASETLARLGRSLLALGMGVEVSVQTLDGETVLSAASLEELADLVVQVWKEKEVPEALGESAASSDLIIAGSGAFANRAVVDMSDRKPTLVVLDSGAPSRMGLRARVVSEGENMENLLAAVIAT